MEERPFREFGSPKGFLVDVHLRLLLEIKLF